MTRHLADALGALVAEQLAGPRPHLAPALLAAALADLTPDTTLRSIR